MKRGLSLLLSLGYCTLTQGFFLSTATAQVTPDGTTNTTVNVNGNDFTIEQGDRAGSNLFHSFSDFSVPTDGSAFFNNAADVVNIFSRVTGRNISNIDGLLRANGAANLFLINPAGIIFGEGARLDIGGSFLGSTADSIVFPDGNFRATDLANSPVLTINAPIGLSFRDNPGDITVRGDGQGTRTTSDLIDTEKALRVDSNQTFALVGGNLNLEGATIKTAGGRIELGSVEGNEKVNLTRIDKDFSLGYEGVQNFRDIQLSQTTTVDASGEGGGNIRVQGQNITLTDGSTIEASTVGVLPGGNLEIAASESLEILGTGPLSTGLFAQVYSEATGAGGNLSLKAKRLGIRNGGVINTSTFGNGNGGILSINVSDLIEVTDDPSVEGDFTGILAQVDIDVEGNGGVLNIESERINFQGADIFISTSTFGKGNSGELNIIAKQLTISDGAEVQAITFSDGDGGNLTIEASDLVQVGGLLGTSVDSFNTGEGVSGGIFASAIRDGIGNGGDLNISTNKLTVQDFGTISVSNFQTLDLFLPGRGAAGNLEINARSVEVNNGTITAANANGIGGELLLNTDSLKLENGASILAETTANTGTGGNINLNVDGNLQMRNNSLISGQATEGATGGNIDINTEFIVAFTNQNNDITANASQGNGGNINITAEALFGIAERSSTPPNETNDIDASSEFGLDGSVSIVTPDINPIQTDIQLPNNPIEAGQTFAQACQRSNVAEKSSGLTVKGKGGTPSTPTDPFDSETILVDESTTNSNPQANYPEIKPIATSMGDIYPARGIIKTEEGKIILTAYATDNLNTRTPHNSAHCNSFNNAKNE